MKKLYDSKEKRTVIRLFLWFLLIAGNVHFYYTQNVAWAIESASRIETMIFVAFLDVTFFLFILIWQGWDSFDSEISIRYLFSFGLSILSYVVFYPAFYNSIHATKELAEIYTLSGHPVVLTGYAVLAAIAAFWTFTGMFPTEAVDIYRGRERKKMFTGDISNAIMIWFQSRIEKSRKNITNKMYKDAINVNDAIIKKTMSLAKPDDNKILDTNQERSFISK